MDLIRAEPGLQARLARALGVTRGAVAKWRRVPAERVLAVEHFSGIPRYDLRPDIFPRPWNDLSKTVSTKSRHAHITHSKRRKHQNTTSTALI